ncbi:uncharacterized protein (TIGR00369 family) [Nocardioides aromaticivorans]|nr:PaaI family thioesterase [Nocardioides aromaticivorans]NYI44424.1 uncharacterized protein (TIGR00369 family) [Nocardioides aromaticivorans]
MSAVTTDQPGRLDPLDPLARQWIEGVLAASPIARHVGITVLDAGVDEVRLGLRFRDDLTTVPGVLHGGVVATLVDVAGASASASGLTSADAATGGATTHLDVAYLAVAGSDLVATAKVVHRTRTGTHTQVAVHDADHTLVATASVTSRIFH